MPKKWGVTKGGISKKWTEGTVTVELRIEKLKWFKDVAGELVAERVEQAADRVVERAREKCPVDTGRTRASINKVRTHQKGWIIKHGVGDPDREKIGFFLELGTRFMSPRPHLYPALEAERPELLRDLKTIFDMLE